MENEKFTEFKDELVQRLQSLGFQYYDSDTHKFMLKFLTNKVENTIKNETNQNEVPEGLHHAFVDMVCGEFLWQLNGMKMLTTDEVLKVAETAIVTQIKVGDTSTSFDAKSSPQALFEALTTALMNDGRKEFVKYRKLVW